MLSAAFFSNQFLEWSFPRVIYNEQFKKRSEEAAVSCIHSEQMHVEKSIITIFGFILQHCTIWLQYLDGAHHSKEARCFGCHNLVQHCTAWRRRLRKPVGGSRRPISFFSCRRQLHKSSSLWQTTCGWHYYKSCRSSASLG